MRDLTTSRTPEASVAAALSRDTKLFERVAPSTYCVRAAYRKDAGDAETIFAEARERIRAFKSGVTDVEDVDDAERDEDSESDVGDDPEVVDLSLKKEDPDALEIENLTGGEAVLENGKLNTDTTKTEPGLPLTPSLPEDVKDDILADQDAVANDEDSACFEESKLGEQWVQGLVEGDYSNLSVEERLNALVALIGIAIEGNTIRIALEVFVLVFSLHSLQCFHHNQFPVCLLAGTFGSCECVEETDVGRSTARQTLERRIVDSSELSFIPNG